MQTIINIDIDFARIVNEYANKNSLSVEKLTAGSRLKEDLFIKRILMYYTYKTIRNDISIAKKKGINIDISDRTIFTEIGKIFNIHFTNVRRNVFLCKKKSSTYNKYIKSLKL